MPKNKLPKIITKNTKRRGRGYGSGKGGHTTGRGMKGQKSRKNLHILFEGVKVKQSFLKRLPLMRGKGKFSASIKPYALSITKLLNVKSGSVVDLNYLVKEGLVSAVNAKKGVKVVGKTKLKNKLSIKLPLSKGAKESIEKAGGNVEQPGNDS